MRRVLKFDGIFILSMVEGKVESQEAPILFKKKDSEMWFTVPGAALYISKYQETELRQILQEFQFDVLWVWKYEYSTPISEISESHLCICSRKR